MLCSKNFNNKYFNMNKILKSYAYKPQTTFCSHFCLPVLTWCFVPIQRIISHFKGNRKLTETVGITESVNNRSGISFATFSWIWWSYCPIQGVG